MQGYSHAYSAPCHIQVVYEGFILTNINNYCARYQPFQPVVPEFYGIDPKSYIYLWNPSQGVYCPSSMDYDLEAFSHNPTHGSFGALPFHGTPLPKMRTAGSSRTKADYCRGTKYISRVKLTCLTTV